MHSLRALLQPLPEELHRDPAYADLEQYGADGYSGPGGSLNAFTGPEVDWMAHAWIGDFKKAFVILKEGDKITVFAWQARDGSNWGHAREVTFADGKKLYFGPPAGTGDGGTTPAVDLPKGDK